ncbi:IMPACT family protein [Methylococcus capsulatus]|uniref:IMPACT family protein n=1 Tax=Methylococcus capsulatus TaxID=414 RepID=UPI00030B89F5|nr:YigZ family protein [Methylococcus capsulatus]QXP86626.1 IMPACT family protein [Methylococcus capsulatus]QXP93696.1 IMPACT family protein [Methylococcus capsulatus]UQN11589.1 IMPACT family protein [Methylococcus capsulatus]
MNGKGFVTLKATAEHRTEVKGSLFVAYGGRADTPEQGLAFLRTVAARHPDASHLCWAYRIDDQYRFSDAGEPGGTAGQPILRAIEGQGLDHVVVGVVRYFGGTKLGAGGLVRAYGGTAAEALRTAERQEELPRTGITVEVPFEHMGALYRLLDSLGVEERRETYTEQGLKVMASLPESLVEHFRAGLRDATRGQSSLLEP